MNAGLPWDGMTFRYPDCSSLNAKQMESMRQFNAMPHLDTAGVVTVKATDIAARKFAGNQTAPNYQVNRE